MLLDLQVALTECLRKLQSMLPPELMQPPSLEKCHDAVSIHTAYHKQLEPALKQQGLCRQVLHGLQRGGNCLALIHLLSMHHTWAATPVFAQVAPLIGIYADPGSSEADAQEGAEDASPCLRMPRIQDPGLGKNSYFEQMILGPDAKLVRGLPLHIVQSGELHAWEAAQGWDLLPTCMQAVKAAVQELHEQLRTTAEQSNSRGCSEPEAAGQLPTAAIGSSARSQQPLEPSLTAQCEVIPATPAAEQQQAAAIAVSTPANAEPVAATQQLQVLAVNEEEMEEPLDSGSWVPNGMLPSPGPLGDALVVVQLGAVITGAAEGVVSGEVRSGASSQHIPPAESQGQDWMQSGASTAAGQGEQTATGGLQTSAADSHSPSGSPTTAAADMASYLEDAKAQLTAEARAGVNTDQTMPPVSEPIQAQLEDSCYMKGEPELSEEAVAAARGAVPIEPAADPWAAAESEAAALPAGVVPAASVKMAAVALKNRATPGQQAVTADQYCAMEFAAAAAFDPNLVAYELQAQVSDDGRGSKGPSRMLSVRNLDGLAASGLGQGNRSARGLPSQSGTPSRNTARSGGQSMRTHRTDKGKQRQCYLLEAAWVRCVCNMYPSESEAEVHSKRYVIRTKLLQVAYR